MFLFITASKYHLLAIIDVKSLQKQKNYLLIHVFVIDFAINVTSKEVIVMIFFLTSCRSYLQYFLFENNQDTHTEHHSNKYA